MPDREKVAKDLTDIGGWIAGRVGFERAKNFLHTVDDAIAMLKEQETIVRCKDCKNADYGTDEDGNRFMKCIGSVKCYGGTTPDFFCADGERR